jgi:DNA-directed RNA polymerase beta subunit
MNVGQILETHPGLGLRRLGKRSARWLDAYNG